MPTKKIVLLVEDDKSIVNVLKNQLEEAGFLLLLATDGDLGLKMALKNHPDVILLDVIMPKMDGMTLLKKLREDSWGKSAKVLILTNLSNQATEKQASEYKVIDYIIKTDINLSEVIQRIKKII